MKLKIIKMKDESDGYLEYKTDRRLEENIIDENPVLTLEVLAQMCDLHAEDRNNHAFVGTHRILATMIFKKIGREIATEIMKAIAEYGGLDAMTGHYAHELDGKATIYEELGIKRPWYDWSLSIEGCAEQSKCV